MDISQVVLSTLAESAAPMKAGEIAQQTGLDKADVNKAIQKLKKEEKIFSPKNCFYTVKK